MRILLLNMIYSYFAYLCLCAIYDSRFWRAVTNHAFATRSMPRERERVGSSMPRAKWGMFIIICGLYPKGRNDMIIFTLSLRAQATNGMILCVFREWKDEIRVGDARVAIF